MENTDLNKKVENINFKEELSEFILKLKKDFEEDPSSWENNNLSSYLETISAWVTDMDSYYKNQGIEFDKHTPSWKTFGEILLAGKVYE